MAKPRFRDVKQGRVSSAFPSAKSSKRPQAVYPDKRTRSKAFITDSFMLLIPIMYIVFYLVMGGREGFRANMLLGWIDILVPLIFVQIAFIAKTGQTPGMRAYTMRVVNSRTLQPAGFGQIVLRQILAPVSRLFFGWILMFFRADHRQPHEVISRTTLILTDDPGRQQPVS